MKKKREITHHEFVEFCAMSWFL